MSTIFFTGRSERAAAKELNNIIKLINFVKSINLSSELIYLVQ